MKEFRQRAGPPWGGSAADVAEAHKADLETQTKYGVNYLRLRSKEDRARGLVLTVLYPKRKDMTVPPITEIRALGHIQRKRGEKARPHMP